MYEILLLTDRNSFITLFLICMSSIIFVAQLLRQSLPTWYWVGLVKGIHVIPLILNEKASLSQHWLWSQNEAFHLWTLLCWFNFTIFLDGWFFYHKSTVDIVKYFPAFIEMIAWFSFSWTWYYKLSFCYFLFIYLHCIDIVYKQNTILRIFKTEMMGEVSLMKMEFLKKNILHAI